MTVACSPNLVQPGTREDLSTIRDALPADADACAEIHILARRRMTYLPQDLHSDAETRQWNRDVVFTTHQVLVAEDEAGEIIGYLALDGEWLMHLYVRPDSQRQGAGSALLDAAKARSPGWLRLWVFQPNSGAIRFYERHGFRAVRETDGRDNEERVPDALMVWTGVSETGCCA